MAGCLLNLPRRARMRSSVAAWWDGSDYSTSERFSY